MKDLPSIFLDQLETGSSVKDALLAVDDALKSQIDALKDVIKEYNDEVSEISDIAMVTKLI